MNIATRKKSCRFCETAERSGRPAPKHDCKKNWVGSAKAMESSMAVELLKDQPGDNFKISKVTSDLDSTLDAHLKKEIGRITERKLDKNHLTKTLITHLHQLKEKHKKLTPTFISNLVKCFSNAVGQNKDDPSKMEFAINNIVFHVSGKHDECQEWCCYVKDPSTYRHKSLPFGKPLHYEDLIDSLSKLFRVYALNAEKLCKLGSTQGNENFNGIVASIAPKSRHYNSSDSLDFRVSTAVCKKNIGTSYSVELMQMMNIPLLLKFQERVKCIDEAMRKRSLSIKLKPAKKRRIELKEKRKQREDVTLVKEGDTFESGVQLRNEGNNYHVIIPSFSPLPVEEPIELKDNIIFISADVEATSNDGIRAISPRTRSPGQNPPGQNPLEQNPPRTKSPWTKSPQYILYFIDSNIFY